MHFGITRPTWYILRSSKKKVPAKTRKRHRSSLPDLFSKRNNDRGIFLKPKPQIPVHVPGRQQIVLPDVKVVRIVKDELLHRAVVVRVLWPDRLVVGPEGVRVAGLDEGHEVLLHLEGDIAVYCGGLGAGEEGVVCVP